MSIGKSKRRARPGDLLRDAVQAAGKRALELALVSIRYRRGAQTLGTVSSREHHIGIMGNQGVDITPLIARI
jgi:hypothetical protein